MKNIKHICFDLDGTLVDSHTTIYKSTLKALEKLNIKSEMDHARFGTMIGHHFIDIFKDMKVEVPDIENFINIYKGFYFDFIDDSILYPEAENTLKLLIDNKLKVSLLTTKAQGQADKIIDHFKLRKYFDYVMGRRPGVAIKPSGESLEIICNELNVKPLETLFVGDTELDMRCGKNAGAKTCAVSFGYRTLEELKNENPDFIIDGLGEIFELL